MNLTRRLLSVVFLVALFIPLLVGIAGADHFPQDGVVFLSFDPDVRVRSLDVPPLFPFDVYVVVDGLSQEILAIEGSVDFGPSIEVLEVEWLGVGIDLGPLFPIPDGINFIAAFGECFPASSSQLAVGRIRAMLIEPADNIEVTVGAPPVGPASPSSFDGEGPGWADCASELFLFGIEAAGNGVTINGTVVSNGDMSWGAVKARF